MITSVYPGEGTPKSFTPVVHYFTKEWVKMGYDVRVIHTCTYFPAIFYKAPNFVRKFLQNRYGIALPEERLNKDIDYVHEDVKVHRVCMPKLIPMSSYSENVLSKAASKISDYLHKENFTPDLCIAHWVNPQAYLLNKVKMEFGCPTTLVLHDPGVQMKVQFKKNWQQLVNSVDIWGYRSLGIKKGFEENFGTPMFAFRCFSGIPEYYTKNAVVRDGKTCNKIVYVGLLIDRKYPNVVIDAVSKAYKGTNYKLELIGEGSLRPQLENQIRTTNLTDNVRLLGRIPREEVMAHLDQSDIFILVSSKEVFGLVYIEAMSRGCITIASRGEGMEGIIEDGVNGFFCEAGNTEELQKVLHHIQSLTAEERAAISKSAIETSLKLTDVAVARDYIQTVEQYAESVDVKPTKSSSYHSLTIGIGGGSYLFINKLSIQEKLRQYKRRYCQWRYGLKHVAKTFYPAKGSSIAKDLTAGDYSYIGTGSKIYPKVKLGRYTMIANDVMIMGSDHYFKDASLPTIFSGREELKETIIGDDVWVGARSIIMTGIKIGNGAIVAAGSVVTKDVEPYSIVAGVPAKKIKMRFTPEEIDIHEAMLKQPLDSFGDIAQLLSSGRNK